MTMRQLLLVLLLEYASDGCDSMEAGVGKDAQSSPVECRQRGRVRLESKKGRSDTLTMNDN